MRLHPVIPGTVALWQFQNDLKDYSGNNFNLTAVDRNTHAAFSGGVLFASLSDKVHGVVTTDPCIVGVDLYGSDYPGNPPSLMAPLASALQLAGPATWEWIGLQRATFSGTYICCADPGGRSGGNGPDRIGSLYTLWWDTTHELAAISDQHIGSNLPSVGYGDFPSANITNWAGVNLPSGGDWSFHHFCYTRDGSGNWFVYRDGSVVGTGPLSAGTNVPDGTEVTFIGSCEGGNDGGVGYMASLRVLNFTRAASDVLADANHVLSNCAVNLQYRGVNIRLDKVPG